MENISFQKYLEKFPVGSQINLGESLLSFTLSKEIAINSYKISDKYKFGETTSILYILSNRKSKFLDISEYSNFPNEKEVLSNKNLNFEVIKIEQNLEELHLIYFLDEI